MVRFLMMAALALLATPAAASDLSVTPATLTASLKQAACGDTLTLVGKFGAVNVPKLTCPTDRRLEIDASAATMTSLVIRSTAGVNVQGGTVGDAGSGAAVTVDFASFVRLSGMTAGGARVGFALGRSTDIDLIGNRCDAIRSDCINIAGVQRANVIGNHCGPPNPILATYDDAGKLIKDGDHPDCIQGWSIVGRPNTTDINLIGNSGVGYMQGIFFGNSGQGGYDRITVRDNDFVIGAFNGILVNDGRKTLIRNNRVVPTPGARLPGGNRGLVWPWVSANGDVVACGNVVAAQASRYGTEKCR